MTKTRAGGFQASKTLFTGGRRCRLHGAAAFILEDKIAVLLEREEGATPSLLHCWPLQRSQVLGFALNRVDSSVPHPA
jgi:hypothetical protein